MKDRNKNMSFKIKNTIFNKLITNPTSRSNNRIGEFKYRVTEIIQTGERERSNQILWDISNVLTCVTENQKRRREKNREEKMCEKIMTEGVARRIFYLVTK